LQSSVSALQRYFYRPHGAPFDALKYNRYFEHFVVSKTCPKSFDAAQGASASDSHVSQHHAAPCLDDAPPGQQHFVCPRRRGEPPLCRLEMKFPRQNIRRKSPCDLRGGLAGNRPLPKIR
jgi:hypothetical protein